MTKRQAPEGQTLTPFLPITLPGYVRTVLESDVFKRYRGQCGGQKNPLDLFQVLGNLQASPSKSAFRDKVLKPWGKDVEQLGTLLATVMHKHNDPEQAKFLEQALKDPTILWPGEELIEEECIKVTLVMIYPELTLPILQWLELASSSHIAHKCLDVLTSGEDPATVDYLTDEEQEFIATVFPRIKERLPYKDKNWQLALQMVLFRDGYWEGFNPTRIVRFNLGTIYEPKIRFLASEDSIRLYEAKPIGIKLGTKISFPCFVSINNDLVKVKAALKRHLAKKSATWSFRIPKRWLNERADRFRIQLFDATQQQLLTRLDRRCISFGASRGVVGMFLNEETLYEESMPDPLTVLTSDVDFEDS